MATTARRRPTTNGSIHGMSLLVGELLGKVDHINENMKMQAEGAETQRQKLHDKIDSLQVTVYGLKNDAVKIDDKLDNVQQDVAEMKNDAANVKATLEEYQANKITAEIAIQDVGKLKEFMALSERKEQRVLGWWDIIKGLSRATKVILGTIGAIGAAMFVWWLQGHM